MKHYENICVYAVYHMSVTTDTYHKHATACFEMLRTSMFQNAFPPVILCELTFQNELNKQMTTHQTITIANKRFQSHVPKYSISRNLCNIRTCTHTNTSMLRSITRHYVYHATSTLRYYFKIERRTTRCKHLTKHVPQTRYVARYNIPRNSKFNNPSQARHEAHITITYMIVLRSALFSHAISRKRCK